MAVTLNFNPDACCPKCQAMPDSITTEFIQGSNLVEPCGSHTHPALVVCSLGWLRDRLNDFLVEQGLSCIEIDTATGGMVAYDEHLHRKCLKCSFLWREECADGGPWVDWQDAPNVVNLAPIPAFAPVPDMNPAVPIPVAPHPNIPLKDRCRVCHGKGELKNRVSLCPNCLGRPNTEAANGEIAYDSIDKVLYIVETGEAIAVALGEAIGRLT